MSENPDDHFAYQAGYGSGQRFCVDVLRKRRVGIDRRPGSEGRPDDLIEDAAQGWVPDDVIEQVEERVDPEVRVEFKVGFADACLDHVTRRNLGLGDN